MPNVYDKLDVTDITVSKAGNIKSVVVNLHNLHSDKFVPPPTQVSPEVEEMNNVIQNALDTLGHLSHADNDARTREIYEGRANFKKLYNELNFPRGKFNQPDKEKILQKIENSKKHHVSRMHEISKEMLTAAAWKVTQLANETKALISAHEKRLKTLNKMYEREPVNIVNFLDTWYEKPFYGKVDTAGALIYYSQQKNATMPLIAIDDEGEIKVLQFVAMAFKGLQEEFNNRPLNKKSIRLQKINPKRGASSFEGLYEEHINLLYTDFDRQILRRLRNTNKIKDFNDFYNLFIDYIKAKDESFTLIGFAESVKNNIYTSGLAIDILESDPSSDLEKVEFYDDSNYEVFSYLTRKHGFRIDPNVPWRIIADVSSTNMWEYLSKDTNVFAQKTTAIATDASFTEETIKKLYEIYFDSLYSNITLYDFVYRAANFYEDFRTKNPFYYDKVAGTDKQKRFMVFVKKIPRSELAGLDKIIFEIMHSQAEIKKIAALQIKNTQAAINEVAELTSKISIKLNELYEAIGNRTYKKEIKNYFEKYVDFRNYEVGKIFTSRRLAFIKSNALLIFKQENAKFLENKKNALKNESEIGYSPLKDKAIQYIEMNFGTPEVRNPFRKGKEAAAGQNNLMKIFKESKYKVKDLS